MESDDAACMEGMIAERDEDDTLDQINSRYVSKLATLLESQH